MRFTKMHGTGNDFMVLDKVRQGFSLSTESIVALANRKTGIGFDQLLIVEPTERDDCDFLYRIYNADGSAVEHCGNGARCVTKYIRDQGLSDKDQLTLEMPMGNGTITCKLLDDGQVTVDMGTPITRPARIPFLAPEEAPVYSLPLPAMAQSVDISAVSMGNPHAVLVVDDVETAPVEKLGPVIEKHPSFPKKVNVGFMQILSPASIRLRVFERGAGETLACGTGACAAVVAGQIRGLLGKTVTVTLNGGTLTINWNGANAPVLMTGPATTVFEGHIEL